MTAASIVLFSLSALATAGVLFAALTRRWTAAIAVTGALVLILGMALAGQRHPIIVVRHVHTTVGDKPGHADGERSSNTSARRAAAEARAERDTGSPQTETRAVPRSTAGSVLMAAGVVILAGAALKYTTRKRRRALEASE